MENIMNENNYNKEQLSKKEEEIMDLIKERQ
jgi:uncharacterized membrane protein